MDWLLLWSALGAVVQLYFGFKEIFRWDREFVRKAARAWLPPHKDASTIDAHIEWSKPLAANIGAYNWLIALGLAWTAREAWVDGPLAGPFGVFLGIFLLGAAAAAGITRVYPALAVQGSFGALILVASL